MNDIVLTNNKGLWHVIDAKDHRSFYTSKSKEKAELILKNIQEGFGKKPSIGVVDLFPSKEQIVNG